MRDTRERRSFWSRPRRVSTALRLAALHGTVQAVVLGVVAFTLVSSFSTSYESVTARELAAQIRTFATAAAHRPSTESLESFAVSYLEGHALAVGQNVIVDFRNGRRVETSGARLLDRSALIDQLADSHVLQSRSVSATIDHEPVEIVTEDLEERPVVVATVLATANLTSFAAERSRVLALSLAEAAIAFLAAITSSFLLLRQLLRTVGRIRGAADELGRSNLDRRLGPYESDDEVGELARTFDEMLDRIGSSMQAQRRLLADVSHQLRTPLTVARGHLEVLGLTGTGDKASVDDTIALVIDELGHMGAVVERLLMLGHAMDPEFLVRVPVDLRTLLGDCLAAGRILAPRVTGPLPFPDLVIEVDEDKMRGAILNLVSNAVRATTAEGVVVLDASLRAGGELEIVVEDDGPGIPPARREAVLRRFSQSSALATTEDVSNGRAAGGTGLGLAIVKAVAEAHGGHVDIGDAPGGGARVAIVLPGDVVHVFGELL